MTKTPAVKVFVQNSFLTGEDSFELTAAYLLAVDCRKDSIIRFTVYLETGALWSGLPICALWCDRFNKIELSKDTLVFKNESLQPYSCLEGPVSVIEYDLIKNGYTSWNSQVCRYLFTINYEGGGLSEDPEQYKSHNIVVLENGQLAALPNNFLRFHDNWFTDFNKPVKDYKRSNKYYFSGG